MCDGRLGNAQAPGDRCVRVARLRLPANQPRQVHWRQTMPLLVLGGLRIGIGRHVTNHDRDFGQPRTLRRTPALRAEVNAVPTLLVGRMNDDRLQDAVLTNVFRQRIQLCFRELGARVVRVFDQKIEQHQQRAPSARNFTASRGLRRARRRGLSCGLRPLVGSRFSRQLRIGVEKLELT
jgi:hypothetical protein